LTVGWPGSVADGRIWRTSKLNARLEDQLSQLPSKNLKTKVDIDSGDTRIEAVPAFILADAAYPSGKRMVPTFKTTDCNRCAITKALNKKLASVRNFVEMAFGLCKGRFRIFHRPMECAGEDIHRAIILVTAIFTIHNFLIEENDSIDIDEILRDGREVMRNERAGEEDDDGIEEDDDGADEATRSILWRHVCYLRSPYE
jgi:DDE superfamily endonuclease